MENIEEKNYAFCFDDLDVLGIRGGRVYVRGVEDFETPCVLAVKKSTFKKMFSKWLEEKEDFCKRYKEFCGVGGYVYCEVEKWYDTQITNPEADFDIDDPNWKEKMYMPVVAYKVIRVDEHIDMEHG